MEHQAAVLQSMGAAAPYAKSKPLIIEKLELDQPGPGEVWSASRPPDCVTRIYR